MKKVAKKQGKMMTAVPGFRKDIVFWDCGHQSSEQGILEIFRESDCRHFDKGSQQISEGEAVSQKMGSERRSQA